MSFLCLEQVPAQDALNSCNETSFHQRPESPFLDAVPVRCSTVVELVGLLCTQPCSVRDSTAQPYPLPSPTTIPRPIALFAGQSHYNWVGRTTIGSGVLLSGRACCYWVGRAVIRSGALLSGQSHCYWAYLVHFPSMLLFRSFAHSSPPLPVKV